MMFCRSCGKQIEDSAVYCPYCGAYVKLDNNANSASNSGGNPVGASDTGKFSADEAVHSVIGKINQFTGGEAEAANFKVRELFTDLFKNTQKKRKTRYLPAVRKRQLPLKRI